MDLIIITIIIALATFIQAMAGFGLALVSMPLLVGIIGIRQAAPLIVLIGFGSQVIMLTRYRQQIMWSDIREMVMGSVVGIPLGVLALTAVSETLVTLILGAAILGYAIYSLITQERPPLTTKNGWLAYGAGLTGGLLTGAYSSGGPPLVIYASARRWPPYVFKGNIQTLLIVHSTIAIFSHSIAGNMTTEVVILFLTMIPVLITATIMGFIVERYVNARRFHQMVLVFLILLGLRLIMSNAL